MPLAATTPRSRAWDHLVKASEHLRHAKDELRAHRLYDHVDAAEELVKGAQRIVASAETDVTPSLNVGKVRAA